MSHEEMEGKVKPRKKDEKEKITFDEKGRVSET